MFANRNRVLKTAAALSLLSAIAFAGPASAFPIQTPDKPANSCGNWYVFNNVRTDARGGVRLLDCNGNPIRATKIRVFATDISWQFTYASAYGFITSPNGSGGAAPPGYNFPGKPIQGIIVFQGPVTSATGICDLAASATSGGNNATLCSGLNNGADIRVTVNDGVISATPTDNQGHDDNGSSFDLHVKIVTP
jgi:hypothetical protein